MQTDVPSQANPEDTLDQEADFDMSGRPWWQWLLGIVVGLILLVAAAVPLGLWWLGETRNGRAFVAQQISGLEPESGLRFEVGRIDGSLLSAFQLVDVVVYDLDGKLALIPRADVDWQPVTLVSRMVSINRLNVPDLRMLRMWHIHPSDPNEPLLPNIDVRIDRFDFGRIQLDKPVVGTPQLLKANGRADIDSGRVLLLGDVASDKGDKLHLDVDAEPDADNFDLKADLLAPVGGIVAQMAGLQQPLSAKIGGNGTWRQWRGQLKADLGGDTETRQVLADLAITADSGRFRLKGDVFPQPFAPDSALALISPGITLDIGAAKPKDAFEITLDAQTEALVVSGRGALDATDNILEDLKLEVQLQKPGAVYPGLSGQQVQALVSGSGPLQALDLDWTVKAAQLRYADPAQRGAAMPMGADALLAQGKLELRESTAQKGGQMLVVPVKVTAGKLVGLPDAMADLLQKPVFDARILYAQGDLRAENLLFTTSQLKVSGDARMTPKGDMVANLNGQLGRYEMAGLGELGATVKAMISKPAAGVLKVAGQFEARALRLESAGARDFLGGLPVARGQFAMPDTTRFIAHNLSLNSPSFNITGAKADYQLASGQFKVDAAGRSADYGAFTLTAAGTPQAPVATLTMPNPDFGFGVQQLVARLQPENGGLRLLASGESPQGELDLNALVGLKAGQPLSLDISRAALAGLEVHGRLEQTPSGPFAGRLLVDGRGLDTRLDLSAQGNVQRADLRVRAVHARLPLEVPVNIGSGAADFTLLLMPDKPTIKGAFKFNNITRDGVVLNALRGSANLTGTNGIATISTIGRLRDGQSVSLRSEVRSVPDGYAVSLGGRINRQLIQFEKPAHIVRLKDGWELKPARLTLPKGQVHVSGKTGNESELRLNLRGVDLSLADAFVSGLGMGGIADGDVVVRTEKGHLLPVGQANLKIAGLKRAGVTGLAVPVDVQLSGSSEGGGVSLGARFSWQTTELGRLVLKVAPGPGATPAERFMAGQLSGGIRYNGPVTPLWAMADMEGQELKGAVAIGADFAGTPAIPELSGTARGSGMVYRNAAFGTEINAIEFSGEFSKNQLLIRRFSGRTPGVAASSGRSNLRLARGSHITFGAEPNFDFALRMDQAQLANSDLAELRLSGDISLRGSASNAIVSGNMEVNSARIQIVQLQNSEVPSLNVRRSNQVAAPVASSNFRLANIKLDVNLKADDVVKVEGMGLESTWRANVHAGGNLDNMAFTGNANLVRGDFTFAGSEFKLTRGQVVFNGQPMDSSIDVQAETRAEDVTAYVNIGGTAARPDLRFTSSPSLPQDEILARLLFGASVADLSVTEAVQLATAVASLQSGTDAMGKLRRSVGIDRLRLVGDNSETGMGTGIAVGKRLSKNVYVEVQTDSRGNTLSNLQFTLSRLWSLFVEVSSMGDSSANVRYQREY